MKLKEQEIEKEGMNKELYNLFIEMIQFEYNKSSFLKGAKFYCWANGIPDYYNFFNVMTNCCTRCKNDFIYYLLGRFEIIPEIKVASIKTEFKSTEDVFSEFMEMEEAFIDLLERIMLKAKEIDDVKAMAFVSPMLNKIDHIACRAFAAVKNNKNPFDLVKYDCENNISC